MYACLHCDKLVGSPLLHVVACTGLPASDVQPLDRLGVHLPGLHHEFAKRQEIVRNSRHGIVAVD